VTFRIEFESVQNCDVVLRVSQQAPEEPNVYRLRVPPLPGAPVARNVLADEYVEPSISLRWSEEPYRLQEPINIRSLRD